MIIDHIGIVVKSIEKGVERWEKLFGYRRSTKTVLNSRQQVRVVFLEKKNSISIKLIEPADSTSPIYNLAKKGGGLHHLCFRCDDMVEELSRLQEEGLRVLAAPQPGEAFENENIAFVYAGQGLSVELIDTDKRAGKII